MNTLQCYARYTQRQNASKYQGNAGIHNIFPTTIFEMYLATSPESATGPYSERDKSSTHPHTCFFKMQVNSPVYSQVSQGNPHLGIRTNICTTCFSHLTLIDLFTLILFRQEYKLRNSSLCDFKQPPVTTTLFVSKHSPSTWSSKNFNPHIKFAGLINA